MSHHKTTDRRDDDLVASLSEAARHVAEADTAAGVGPSGWHRLQAARARHAAPRFGVWTRVLVVAAGLALAWGGWALQRPRPLTYVVSGGQFEANGYVRGSDREETQLTFSDGTRVRLARGTRMSVGAPGPHGAHLRVEAGEAHFEVIHRPNAEWSVEAGPYRVLVTGTTFDVRWPGNDDAATVWLRAGAVRVTGPNLASPVALSAGQRLHASLATAEVRIESPAPEAALAPAPAPLPTSPREAPPAVDGQQAPPAVGGEKAPPVGSQKASPSRHAPARRPPSPLHPETWSTRVAAGQAAGVLAEARALSLGDVLATVDAPALGALADAARYSREPSLAAQTFFELRRRFPSSTQAHAAAFLLGRAADDSGDAPAALSWYRLYRAEAPRGPYAAEALGREMLAVERLSGRPAAAAVARTYVEQFPDGTYILQARAILGLP